MSTERRIPPHEAQREMHRQLQIFMPLLGLVLARRILRPRIREYGAHATNDGNA